MIYSCENWTVEHDKIWHINTGNISLKYDIRYQNIVLDDLAVQMEDIDVEEDDDVDEKDDAELCFEKHSGTVYPIH